jgi:hypothetical protein
LDTLQGILWEDLWLLFASYSSVELEVSAGEYHVVVVVVVGGMGLEATFLLITEELYAATGLLESEQEEYERWPHVVVVVVVVGAWA